MYHLVATQPQPALFGAGSEWFWGMAQAVAVTATLLLILQQISLQRKATALTSFGQMNEQWNSEELLRARAAIAGRATVGQAVKGSGPRTVATFFEEMGLHLKKGVFDTEYVWDRYSFSALIYWRLMAQPIKQLRKDDGDDSWYCNYEYLVKRLQAFGVRRRRPTLRAVPIAWTAHRIEAFELDPDLKEAELRFLELECELFEGTVERQKQVRMGSVTKFFPSSTAAHQRRR